MEITSSALSSGLNGIKSGQRRAEQAAFEIAGNSLPAAQPENPNPAQNQVNPTRESAELTSPDLTESLVSLRVAENEVSANARVVDTADEVLGTLIDTRA